jgi:hypothetical protein
LKKEIPMNKRRSGPPILLDALDGWTKESDHLHVHASGTKIERRGYPIPYGWYLVYPDDDEDSVRRFEPTSRGCDQAFVAFAARKAFATFLSGVLRNGDHGPRRAG